MKSGIRPALSVALLVGVDDRVAAICAAAAMEAGIAILRVPHGPAACRAMHDAHPEVVVLPPTLWRDERDSITAVCREIGAHVLDVPRDAAPAWLALVFVRAASGATSESDRLCG
jgi:hypothetical protein